MVKVYITSLFMMNNLLGNKTINRLLMINFIFSLLYFGPMLVLPGLCFVQDMAVTCVDIAHSLMYFKLDHVTKDFRSFPVKPILDDEDKYTKALSLAYNSPNKFTYLHEAMPSCNHNVQMLILVKSAAKNIALRQGIRLSWGRHTTGVFCLRFLLGRNESLQPLVDLESDWFRDIIQRDFTETFAHNTYKTIMGFDWSVHHCSNAKFTLFVDDDHYINTNAIFRNISAMPADRKEQLFVGMLTDPGFPSRNPRSKYYVSRSTYPYPQYPPYLSGGAYVVSKTVVKKLFGAFPFIRYYWIDDVWLGIVAHEIGIKPTGDVRFDNLDYDFDIGDSFLSHRKSHDPAEIVEIWKRQQLVR